MAQQATPVEVEKPRLGRPPKLVEDEKLLTIISGLAKIQCTQEEAAAVLGVDADTFRAFLDKNERSFEAWCSGPAVGRVSLRRLQFQAAQKGNPRLLVWLGKQWLEQRDKFDGRVAGANGGPIHTENTHYGVAPVAIFQIPDNGRS